MERDDRKPSRFFRIVHTIFASIGIGYLLLGAVYNIDYVIHCKTHTTKDRAEYEKEHIVSAYNTVPIDSLISSYDANELRADELYEGKLLRVSGIVANIGFDIFYDSYVTIKSPEISTPQIRCVLKDSKTIKKYYKGDKITVIGICTGLTGLGTIIYFDQCEDVVMPL
jgi:hypothetical protein